MNTDLGFAHFLTQSDTVGKVLLVILIAMSVASWAIIAVKGLTLALRKGRSSAFLDFFWNARSLEAVAGEIATHGARDPFSHLTSHAMHAQAHHARYGAAKLEEAGTSSEFVTRTIKKVLDEETTRLDNGLAVLATVGATAPFVGLFGTVWGVYHALVAIGMSGSGTLDKVAGPVGEALIMTGLGPGGRDPGGGRLQLADARQPRARGASSTPSPTSCTPSSRWASRSARASATAARPTFARSPPGRRQPEEQAMAFASFDPRQGGAPMAEINMVPLIDVMLVLLVIFIITAPLLTQAVKLELPKASSQVNDLKPEKIDFAIDAQGQLYWNGEKLSRADAAARFRDEAGKTGAAGGSPACRPGRRVSLRRAGPGRCVEGRADPDRLRERARDAVKPQGDESGAAASAPASARTRRRTRRRLRRPGRSRRARAAFRAIASEALFGGAGEVQISHRGSLYRLKQTALGKLILTK